MWRIQLNDSQWQPLENQGVGIGYDPKWPAGPVATEDALKAVAGVSVAPVGACLRSITMSYGVDVFWKETKSLAKI